MGLYDREHFTETDESSNCECGSFDVTRNECQECRDHFVWIDGTRINAFAPWHDSEPDLGERCIRLANGDGVILWRGSPCSEQLDYVCSRGNIFNYLISFVCYLQLCILL